MESAKSTQWSFTAYEAQWDLFKVMPELVAEWGWQEEVCPTTERKHYQGWLRTKRQVRFSQLRKILPSVHLEIAKNFKALQAYCKKTDTAVDGTQQHHSNPVAALSMAKALIKVAGVGVRIDTTRCETMDQFKQAYGREYELAVARLLRDDENLIGLYSQPQYERAYVKWRGVWVEKADSEKTDRQTDTRSETESVSSGTDSWYGAFDRT